MHASSPTGAVSALDAFGATFFDTSQWMLEHCVVLQETTLEHVLGCVPDTVTNLAWS